MAQLERVTFEIGRSTEYFSVSGLEKMTGQRFTRFADVIIKELIDNALDACESIKTAPEVALTVIIKDQQASITVADNGPGLPAETVRRMLNFNTLVSDKHSYKAPLRGAQGNAAKTLLGIPHALGGTDPVTIEAQGVRHRIAAAADPTGEPRIEHREEPIPPTHGTRITVVLPARSQELRSESWARGFALFNPHASISLEASTAPSVPDNRGNSTVEERRETINSYRSTVDFPGKWRKHLPIDLTAPAWYTVPDLHRLVALLARDRDQPLRDFVRQFKGLSGTSAAKSVCDQIRHKRLSDIAADEKTVDQLLSVMQQVATPPKPTTLGRVGEEHYLIRFSEWYGSLKRHWYKKTEGQTQAGIPYVIEVCIAETEGHKGLYPGVNFSPCGDDPFSLVTLTTEEVQARGLVEFLKAAHAWSEPAAAWSSVIVPLNTAIAVHLVCPALTFVDRGKAQLKLSDELTHALSETLWAAAKELYKEGERRGKLTLKQRCRQQAEADKSQREAERQERREYAAWEEQRRQIRRQKLFINEAVFAVLPRSLEHASGNGRYRVSARTLFYSVRRFIQELTADELEYSYFSQTCLTQYRRRVGPIEGLYYEPRGILYEPHGGREIPLGTREVESYEFPSYGFNKILYLEKKGLYPLLQQSQLGERYDMAIIAAEGFATEAARFVFAKANREERFRFFVLHDADPSGYDIARTLREATRRMPDYQVDVFDLGLRFEDGLERGLLTEKFPRKKALSARLELTERELKAFTGVRVPSDDGKPAYQGDRIELNALTAPEFIAYVEERLKAECGETVDKVVPPAAVLESEARTWYHLDFNAEVTRLVEKTVRQLVGLERFQATAESVGLRIARESQVAVDFTQAGAWVESAFAEEPTGTWSEVLKQKVYALAGRLSDEARSQIEEHVRQSLGEHLRAVLEQLS